MKILITSYYELKEALLGAANALIDLNIEVINYPLMKHKNELDNYIEHFDNFIKESKPDIILWWYITIPVEDFAYLITNNKIVK